MNYYLAFDVGTTAMKCVLYDAGFDEISGCRIEYDLVIKGRTAELDAETYYNVFCECTDKILSAGVSPAEIRAVTFTTQGETIVPVDKNGEPLRRAIVWLDSRAEKETEFIIKKFGKEKFYRTTGLWEPDGALPVSKVLWIKNNEPEIYEKTHKFLLLEDYLIFKLTGKFVTEKSLVSSTGWYDIVNDRINDVPDVCGIDEDKFPEVLDCGKIVSHVIPDKRAGLFENTFVVTGAMDQVASAIGAGNIEEGVVTETTGTALVLGATVEKPVFDCENPVTIYKHYDNRYIYMPFGNTAGVVLKWFRDNLSGKKTYRSIDKMAEKSAPGSSGVMLLPYFSGKNVDGNMPFAEGAFFGLTLGTKREDLTRSVLEGIAYMLREMTEALEAKDIKISEVRSLGGGSTSDLWCEIKASVLKRPIARNDYSETTAMGAAMLGAVACGEYKSIHDASETVLQTFCVIKPDINTEEVYEEGYRKYKLLYETLRPIFMKK